jgi:hypothetical protein
MRYVLLTLLLAFIIGLMFFAHAPDDPRWHEQPTPQCKSGYVFDPWRRFCVPGYVP